MDNSQHWAFFRAFLKSPKTVASIVSSSSYTERRVVSASAAAAADVVVELGAGAGGITRSLLQAMRPDARLVVIERTADFINDLERIGDGRLDVVHGCASSIVAELQRRAHPAADAVVSGIPFSTLPATLAAQIMSAIHDALGPGGRFVAYQFTDRVASYARPLFGKPVVEHELRNVPPLRVFTWRKSGGQQSG